jgi:chromosome segregation ATPase
VEHPIRPGWELVEPAIKPERARDVYRFAVPVDAGQTAKLMVQEENQISESALLSNANDGTIADYLRARKLSAKVRDALKKVTDLRAAVDETTQARQRDEQTITDITAEQGRIRENMRTLADRTADLYRTYVTKLTAQEKQLDQLHAEIDALKDKETQQQQALDDYLSNLDVS